jgi:ABC-type spermidine/putrescine transport system permease subunit I
MISRSPSSKQWLLTLPSLAWLGVFFVIPAILIVVTAFRPADLHGGVGAGWTMENIEALRDPAWLPIVWRTVALSAATTLVCLALALPMAFHMARVGPRLRQILLCWSSFLSSRTFSSASLPGNPCCIPKARSRSCSSVFASCRRTRCC